jgi:BirA family biotin operon repressor/biotin-[acetyl-CoA-carboxylase] ligase
MDLNVLLSLLADGEFHSGERLAARVGVTRAAVWKEVKKLDQFGLTVEAGAGKGYRLSRPIELLDKAVLERALQDDKRFDLDGLDIFLQVDSTNRFLMNNPPARTSAMRLCVAEWQSAGRGRLERQWVSPFGSGVCLSAAWAFAGIPAGFSALSLAAGVAAAKAIESACGVAAQLKWPNDLVWGGRKLGGILVESRIESQGRCHVVIGIGLNVSVPQECLDGVSDWRAGAVDLQTAASGSVPGRNAVVAAIAAEFGTLFREFERDSTSAWLDDWASLDFLRGKAIRVVSETDSFDGRGAGIDSDGALLVDTNENALRRVLAGDASVREQ